MTLDEIKTTLANIDEKVSEVKSVIADIESCNSEKSKAILLAAAAKMTTVITGVATPNHA